MSLPPKNVKFTLLTSKEKYCCFKKKYKIYFPGHLISEAKETSEVACCI